MTNKEAIAYLIQPIATSTEPSAEYLKQKEAYDLAIKALEERSQSELISVSERLPEQANQSYLVTVDYGDGLISSCQRFFFGEGIGWNDDCVIAWQPLPLAYQEGENDVQS